MALSLCNAAPFVGWAGYSVEIAPPVQGGQGMGAFVLYWLCVLLPCISVRDSGLLVGSMATIHWGHDGWRVRSAFDRCGGVPSSLWLTVYAAGSCVAG